MKKIAFILGTRPEIIKLSPLVRAAQKHDVPFIIIHTNQHYSAAMDAIFFSELNLPKPRYNLHVGSGSHGDQTGKMLTGIERVLTKEKIVAVVVQGDTNTVLAGALAASKMHIPVVHVEAGLRSFDRFMPEEINRIITDHISDYLCVPTARAAEQLAHEGITRNVVVTGNTVVDAVLQNSIFARKKSTILSKLSCAPKKYFLLTLHRPANVDDKKVLGTILKTLHILYKTYAVPIIFPIHPRTQNTMQMHAITPPEGIRTIDPVGYLDFLVLEKNARLILTDSGGIQEEACILGIPSVTLRENTERPETLDVGASILVGSDEKKIIRGVHTMMTNTKRWKNPFGNGASGDRIITLLKKAYFPSKGLMT